jgi:rfaE bifunctional protein nucleotidyltransferase chain/domain
MIIKKENLHELIKEFKNQAKTIVMTNGCFDILHIGHVEYLKKSKLLGDILIVGLNSDSSVKKLKGPTRPINSELDRAGVLDALKSVDHVCIFDENDASSLMELCQPDFYTKGGEYKIEELPEYATATKLGCKIVLVDMVKGKSTTNLVNQINQH